ncbi:MAG: helix-turn-helix transcriptional regulator [Desulfosarcinaceae bacterium]|nr:helix-turn-helix transcriptional regulator [Desulfosarcinaceae bacterium]
MQLSFAEKLQVLRKRTGLNQGAFGAKAFNLPLDSGRTKIKNIELGKQHPTEDELELLARALEVPKAVLTGASAGTHERVDGELCVSVKVLDRYPKLGAYLEMLNKAVALEDEALIAHIGETLADILQSQLPRVMARVK